MKITRPKAVVEFRRFLGDGIKGWPNLVIAYIAIGVCVGLVTFIAATAYGASFWFALLLYSLFGTISILLTAILHVLRSKTLTYELPDRRNRAVANPVGTLGRNTSLETLPSWEGEWEEKRAMKILAVDDDDSILQLIPKIAAMVGCPNTMIASSGAQALELLERSTIPFDCLLLDINMPGMNGIDLCGRIRLMPAYRDTPIIMLTAMTEEHYLDRAFEAGASDYTSKPFDIIELGDRLKTAALITARQAEITSGGAIGATGQTHEINGVPYLPRLAIPDFTSLIKHSALQNYLTLLSRSARSESYVMAIRVWNNAPLDDTSTAAFKQVASAIEEVFHASKYVMSYVEYGQFVLVSKSADLPNPTATEVALQHSVDQRSRESAGTGDSSIVVSVGMAVRPSSNGTHRANIAIKSAINFARDRAEDKRAAVYSG